MFIRFLIIIGLFLLFFFIYRFFLWWQLKRAGIGSSPDPLLVNIDLNVPTIVYFTTPLCAVCRLRQKPVIQRLTNLIDPLNVVTIDVYEDEQSVKRWKVVNVPTTFILDAKGNPKKVNNGFADEDKLLKQLLQHESRA